MIEISSTPAKSNWSQFFLYLISCEAKNCQHFSWQPLIKRIDDDVAMRESSSLLPFQHRSISNNSYLLLSQPVCLHISLPPFHSKLHLIFHLRNVQCVMKCERKKQNTSDRHKEYIVFRSCVPPPLLS